MTTHNQPKIVFIMVELQQALSPCGKAVCRTPDLDRLAA